MCLKNSVIPASFGPRIAKIPANTSFGWGNGDGLAVDQGDQGTAVFIDDVEHYEFRILSRLRRDASPSEPASSGMKKGRDGGGGRDVFVHIFAVERARLHTLNEGQTIEYEIESNRGNRG
jgi:hypothetical protein